MKKLLPLLICGLAAAQTPPPKDAAPPAAPAATNPPAAVPPAATPPDSTEDQQLSAALSEAGSSPIEFTRVLERHLERFPSSPRRAELERALVKAAMETKDEKRIMLYGERVLAREPDDIQVLDRVTRALLSSDAKDTSERALKYARHYQELIAKLRLQPAPGGFSGPQWQEELDRGSGRAIVLEARATGNLGKIDDAIAMARKSWESFPTAESARELGRWLARAGKNDEAVVHLADAFAIVDSRNTDADRAKDRLRMGELYAKAHGSEKGLGDLILEAYDRTATLLAERRLRLKAADPNSAAARILDFTLSDVDGNKLPLASLQGKAIVFDFWATWCGPCRLQHPLYDEVKKRFHDNGAVVFLSISTDEDHDIVPQFVKELKWNGPIYYEGGLARLLQVSSIPTTVVVDRRGEVISRLNGFVPQRFVDMLSERINEALKNAP
jgi:thiol-disulfide isomerase/thioredoxin